MRRGRDKGTGPGPSESRGARRRDRTATTRHRRSPCRRLGIALPSACRSGWAGSAIHHCSTAASSTRATSSAAAVRRPPEAAEATHLLSGDKLGPAPRHRLGLPRRPARRSSVPSTPTTRRSRRIDVRHPSAGRVGARVEARAASPRARTSPVSTSTTCSRPPSAKAATWPASSAAYDTTPAAPSRARSRRMRSAAGRSWSEVGSTTTRSSPSGQIENPQTGARIVSGRGPQEQHPPAVGADRDRPRLTEGEALGTGPLPRKRITEAVTPSAYEPRRGRR